MNMKWRRFLALFLILSVLPFSAIAETASTSVPTNEAGYPYVLDYFADTPLDVTQYEGKALFLNFFTGWCPYCMFSPSSNGRKTKKTVRLACFTPSAFITFNRRATNPASIISSSGKTVWIENNKSFSNRFSPVIRRHGQRRR